jgi:hypothetical protein
MAVCRQRRAGAGQSLRHQENRQQGGPLGTFDRQLRPEALGLANLN